jgi:hypothetical protein
LRIVLLSWAQHEIDLRVVVVVAVGGGVRGVEEGGKNMRYGERYGRREVWIEETIHGTRGRKAGKKTELEMTKGRGRYGTWEYSLSKGL